MAKDRRSGLGRGLNSLLGDSYDGGRSSETKPSEAAPSNPVAPTSTEHTHAVRERIVVESDESLRPDRTSPLPPIGRQTVAMKNETENVSREIDIEKIEPVVRELTERKESASSLVESMSGPTVIDGKDDSEKVITELPVESIAPNPDQPRTNFKADELEELSHSIERDGLLQPIVVRPLEDGTYQIIAGERRWQASKAAEMKTVPVRVVDVDEGKALELALIENLQRSDLNPIEEAYGYKRLMERNGMTQADVAQAMAKGRSTIANALRLLELPEEAQQLLFEDKITAGHARAILSVLSREGRHKLTQKIVDDKLSVREAENLARLYSGKPNKSTSSRVPVPASYKSVAKTLKDVLETNVKVKSSGGKNKIEIEFKDERDLERIFDELVKE